MAEPRRGKVRDCYFDLPGYPDLMLAVTSDRLSALDVILPFGVPEKGPILSAMTDFWETGPLKNMFETDRVITGSAIDTYLPPQARHNPDLQSRARVIYKRAMFRVEYVYRGYLAGSGWKSYQRDQTACGRHMPPGLKDGSELPFPLFTPTTKAESGHDENIPADLAMVAHGYKPAWMGMEIYQAARQYAASRGIIVADTKFEFGSYNRNGEQAVCLCDEILTPDSSRFWPKQGWIKSLALGQAPPSMDKDPVRRFLHTFCEENGITELDPENPAHLAAIHSMATPGEVVRQTTARYRYVFWALTGKMHEVYLRDHMSINVPVPRRKVCVILGSQSDMHQAESGLSLLKGRADIEVWVMSCHRSIGNLISFCQNRARDFDIFIAGAGKAAQLPAVTKALLCAFGLADRPVLGVGFEAQTEADNVAARLNMTQLPEQAVELDADGQAYFGSDGFLRACTAAVEHEFWPHAFTHKSAELISTF